VHVIFIILNTNLGIMINKTIHISWKSDKIFGSKCFMVEHGLRNLERLNPDWDIEFSDDTDVDNYLRENISGEDYELVKDKGIVEKLDLWRLVKLYNEGGLYIDLDRFVNIPLSEVIGEGIRWVLPTYRDIDFSHDIMLTAAGNPVFGNAAGLNMHRRKLGYSQVYLLGPQTWMHAVSHSLLSEVVESNPGVEVMDRLRGRIGDISFISTYREEPWRDSILFRGGVEYDGIDYELEKRRMYEEFGMDHWTGAYSK
jgi:mannosyltransferase OCH1-like enzyme